MHDNHTSNLPNPSGLCMCGCGETTNLARQTDPRRFIVKGEHVRYIRGHEHRKSPVEYVEEDRGYESPCWTWQRCTNQQGYGMKRFAKENRTQVAHRWYYEREHGPVPAGLVLHHLCANKSCVNPAHLLPMTQQMNVELGYYERPLYERGRRR